MKSEAGVTIYSVSVAPGADATDLTKEINAFMHYVSSNYPNATSMDDAGTDGSTDKGYYMTPDDSTSLSMIFESIIQNIDCPTITLGEEATMVDTISPYFDFENGSATNVTLQTSARNADGAWADPVDDPSLIFSISDDRLTVGGFDFDANYVSETGRGDNKDFYGKQLVVSFTVVPDYDAIDEASATLMGGVLPTNTGFASLVDSNFNSAAEVGTPTLSTYQVTYKVDGEEYISYNRFTGSAVEIDTLPTKEGHTFSGWSYPANIIVSNGEFVMPDEDVEITGTFTANTYNVTYQYSGPQPAGAPSLPASRTAQYGETVTVADQLEFAGYVFKGWNPLQTDVIVTDGGTFTMPDHDVTFLGRFINQYTVSYDLNGGTGAEGVDYSVKTVNVGTEITVNEAPTRSGYTFKGWQEGENTFNPGDAVAVNKNIIFVAQWSRNGGGGGGTTKYTLTYETNGGNEIKTETYISGSIVKLTKVPVKDGYAFEGWYLDEALTEDVTEVKMTKDITVYAAWVTDNGNAGNGHETPDSLNGDDHFAYVVGYPDGTVRPSDNITRAEFAVICARFDNSEYEVVDNFTDIKGHWAEDEIHEAAAHGWIRGYEDNSFKPDQFITRAEAMTMINRVLNRVPETADDLLDNMIKWPDNNDKSAWYYLPVQEATNSHEYEMKNNIYEKWTSITKVTDWTEYQ